MTYQNIQDDDSAIPPRLATDLSSNDISAPQQQPKQRQDPKSNQSGWQDWFSGPRGLLIGLALGLGLALIGSRISGGQAEPAAVSPTETTQVASATVTTVTAAQKPIRQTITTNGTVEAFDLLSVAPQASGLQIQSVNVREGDRVNAGQVLAVLDDSVLRSQIAQAEAQVVAAEAQVAQAQAQAAQAEAEVAEAQENFERYNSLFDQGAISAEELTSRRTQVATQTQTVGSATAAIDSAQATVQSRAAEVQRLRTQLSQTLVLAPGSGVVAEKNATVGDTASTSTPLFRIIDGDQLELAVKVPQSQLAQINVGTPVQIRSSSDANLQLQGQVRSIDPTVDAQTRQATVKVGLPGSDRIRTGMFLQAAIVIGERRGIAVPADAVLPQSDGTFIIYTLKPDNTARANVVNIGDRIPATDTEPAQIEITNGLDEDVPIIVEGASYLQDGDLVNLAAGGSI
ncbi:MAG: efflux RND transporter periplasmic adaptor subunit [Cyanobacteria bacterium J06607_6]